MKVDQKCDEYVKIIATRIICKWILSNLKHCYTNDNYIHTSCDSLIPLSVWILSLTLIHKRAGGRGGGVPASAASGAQLGVAGGCGEGPGGDVFRGGCCVYSGARSHVVWWGVSVRTTHASRYSSSMQNHFFSFLSIFFLALLIIQLVMTNYFQIFTAPKGHIRNIQRCSIRHIAILISVTLNKFTFKYIARWSK